MISFSVVILDVVVGTIVKKKNKPFQGAWFLNIIHGFISQSNHRLLNNGIETLKMIISDEDNPNKETPIIALTANAISGAREMYLEAGFTDFLTKPINIEGLNEMLKKYL